MKLSRKGLKDRKVWEEAGFDLPIFDIDQVIKNTHEHPRWVHMGAGNIFRAFMAKVQQEILNGGKADTGIVAVGGRDNSLIESMYTPYDNLGVAVTLKSDGSIKKTVIASVTEALALNPDSEAEWTRLKEIFASGYLQMVSFTITEKGYNLFASPGNYLSDVEADFGNGPEKPLSYMGKTAALLYARYQAGKLPVAMVSMDNCSHNGDKLFAALKDYAKYWSENGLTEKGFYEYILDSGIVSFPWSMIDKITPRPDANVKKMLEVAGLEDVETKVSSRKDTYVATFVNAEEAQYLVIEDNFPNCRPNLEAAGVIFSDRETVEKAEKMKVCTCLNPLHTALAVYGCLLGYKLIYKEMEDPELKKLVEIIGYKEGLPVVADPGIISPRAFLHEFLNKRLINPFMPDTPQRIATDTSQKIPIRYGETIKAYMADPDLDVKSLRMIPLVIAGWCRYLLGVDDNGDPMELSSDPMLSTLCPYLKNIKLSEVRDFHEDLKPILSNATVFAVDLYEAGLGEIIEGYFKELVAGKGAVRATLKKYVK